MRRFNVVVLLLTGLGLVAAAAFAQGSLAIFTDQETIGSNTFVSNNCFTNNTGFLNPSAETADTGGDGDGFELNPTNAFADGAGYAENTNGPGDRHRYYNYGVSVGASTICGIEVRLDWWLSSTTDTNSMSVELSWDGGTSWTVAQTDTLETSSEHTVVLGGRNDTWGRTWTPAEFSDANFRVRITSNCSGSFCSFRDFLLDWAAVKVHWWIFGPTLTPTPTPTITPTPTVTATPTITPTPTVTPTPTPCPSGNTGLRNPSAQAADTGGDGDGFELNPNNAFADAGGNATNDNGAGDRHRYYDYGISIPAGCSIKGFAVRLDWWLDSTFGTSSMSVELSWNGGTSWTSAQTDTVETTSEHTTTLGGATDTWGRAWTVAEVSDTNFRVRLTSNSDSSFRDFFLDWVPVTVYYGP